MCSLIAKGMGTQSDSALGPFLTFIIMALLSQLNHVCMLAILLRVKTSRNVGAYFGNLRPAAMMAIATDSSAATLPVTMACAETNKLRRKTIDLVFPLGATVNMDGSCIYYVQAVLFLSAMAGYQMTFAQQVQAAVVGALITCGAAPIPGGFIIFIWMILDLADVPSHVDLDELQSYLAVLLAINWFMVSRAIIAGIWVASFQECQQ